jgi:hypothetical protein
LRAADFDILVGINLLREGLDLAGGFVSLHPRRGQRRDSCAARLAHPDGGPRRASCQLARSYFSPIR